jgi:hypothetical protein
MERQVNGSVIGSAGSLRRSPLGRSVCGDHAWCSTSHRQDLITAHMSTLPRRVLDVVAGGKVSPA